MMFASLEDQRRVASKLLLLLLLIHVPLNAAVFLMIGDGLLGLVSTTALIAGAATLAWRLVPDGLTVRLTIAVALIGVISLLLAGLHGEPWQIDLHMYYFAALAILAIYCDWVVILAAATAIAVHHLSLNFLIPSAIYPGGADFWRVMLHAVVVVLEAAALIWMSASVTGMFAAVGRSSLEADTAREAAERANCLAEEARAAERAASEEREALQRRVTADHARVVEALAQGLTELSGGDLTVRLVDVFVADYEKLRTDFNAAVAQLQDTMRLVAGNTQGIHSGTVEISQAAIDLSHRTEQQAASLEETAAALDEITSTVKRTAQGASEARIVVSSAQADAERSSSVVQRAVEAMGAIETSSREISQIVGVVDEIAFQTNLLALNAGVEAARAGETGRGFAVVASEVRALAQRSADAAKEIKALIATSSTQVASGVKLVGETGEALARILEQVTKVSSIVTEIASSAQEQATGLAQVNTAVNQMDHATQQNAAMVEESTAASEALAQEADRLASIVGRFRVDVGSGRDTSKRREAA